MSILEQARASITKATGSRRRVRSALPVIGRQYTGQHALFIDSRRGIYWEALPPVSGAVYDIQTVILRKPRPPGPGPVARKAAAVVQIARRCIERVRAWAALQAEARRGFTLRRTGR